MISNNFCIKKPHSNQLSPLYSAALLWLVLAVLV